MKTFTAFIILITTFALALCARGAEVGDDLSFFLPYAPSYTEEQLATVVAKAKELRAESTRSPAAARAMADAIGIAASLLPPITLNRALSEMKEVSSETRAYLPSAVELLALIRGMGVATACLERPGAPHQPAGPFRYLIAANLFNCEAIMPYWVLEVLRLGLMLQGNPRVINAFSHNATYAAPPGWDPTADRPVAVSIYESGSDDDTPTWLAAAEALWAAAGLRTFVVVNGSLTRQTLMDPYNGKYYKQHRIQFLASLRNAALEPLYSGGPGSFDFVVFINDVYFCAADLFRLGHYRADIACGMDFEIWIGNKKGRAAGVTQRFLRSRSRSRSRQLLSRRSDAGAGAAAGAGAGAGAGRRLAQAQAQSDASIPIPTGYSTTTTSTPGPAALPQSGLPSASQPGSGSGDAVATLLQPAVVASSSVAAAIATPQQSAAAAAAAAAAALPPFAPSTNWHKAIEVMSHLHMEEAARQSAADARILAAEVKPRYEFYDTWVSRDVGGNPYVKEDPISRDKRTIDSLHRGLPLPAKCCWNGAAFINASNLAAGLRFRTGMVEDGEFDMSECSLLCEDYRRLGSKRVVVDPSVRITYLAWTKEVHGRLPGGVGAKVPWHHVVLSGGVRDLELMWRNTRGCMSVQWVPLRKGSEEADLGAFKVVNLNDFNYTHAFLEALRAPPAPPPPRRACNLVLGPYGPAADGRAFDDFAASDWGRRPITAIGFRLAANASGEHAGISGLTLSYGSVAAEEHGGGAGVVGATEGEHVLEPGEVINGAVVYYDDRSLVFGLRLNTSAGRELDIGSFPPKASVARASPCPADPAQAGRYRLATVAGTSDKYLRSIVLFWS